LQPHVVPATPSELETLLRLCEREAALGPCAFLLDGESWDSSDAARSWGLRRFVERFRGPIFVTVRERPVLVQRATVVVAVPRLSKAEQRHLWQRALGGLAESLNGQVDRVLGQFCLDAPVIGAAGAEALQRHQQAPTADLGRHLWDVCRRQARPRLDGRLVVDSIAGGGFTCVPASQAMDCTLLHLGAGDAKATANEAVAQISSNSSSRRWPA